MIYGVDVASYQSENFPLTANARKVDFAIVKATEGTNYVNPRMNGQAKRARDNGLVLGFYAFVRPGDMKAQAKYFVEKCASVEGDILALDWEDSGVSGASKDAFLKEVKRLRPTHKVLLYCNQNFWLTKDKTSYAADGLWLANYTGVPGHTGVQADVLIHQFTSKTIDTNAALTFSSRAAMKSWATGDSKAPSTPTDSKDEDMDLATKVSLGQWMQDEWKLDHDTITVETALGSTYGHSRHVHAKVDALEAQVGELTKAITALTAKLGAE